MTTILPSARSPFEAIMEQVGSGLSQTLPNAVKEYGQRERGVLALNQAEKEISAAGNDPVKMSMAYARAVAQNPALERSLGPYMEHVLKLAAANNSGRITQPGEEAPAARNREPMEPVAPRQQMPNFLGQQQELQNFPDNMGPQGGPGNAPQAATTGVKQPLLTRDQKIAEARKIHAQAQENKLPMTFSDALNLVNASEQDKKEMNAEVAKETEERKLSQEEYGKKAVEELSKVYGAATPEMEAIFKRKGEEASKKGDSEADINKYLATEAKNFANTITNVKKSVAAPRLIDKLGKAAGLNYKDFDQAAADVRSHLKPLLDMGLYDTARNLLTDLDYGPEERDMIINPLGERSKIMLNKVPEAVRTIRPTMGAPISPFPSYDYEGGEVENIKQGLRDLKEADPNFSLLLGRKAFEDKKYDWRMYNEALNELLQEGEKDPENGFKLTADQRTQKGNLDTPPLNHLEKILHGLNLIGR